MHRRIVQLIYKEYLVKRTSNLIFNLYENEFMSGDKQIQKLTKIINKVPGKIILSHDLYFYKEQIVNDFIPILKAFRHKIIGLELIGHL